jgi:hypothetical protein
MAAAFAPCHRYLRPVRLAASKARVDHAARPQRLAPHERQIGAVHPPVSAVSGELLAQAAMRRVILGDDEQSRRSLVEAVHDAGALDPADAGQAFPAMGDQRVDKGTACVPRRWVHDEMRGLVDDDQVVVFVDHVERDRLTSGLGWLRLRHADGKGLPGFDPV